MSLEGSRCRVLVVEDEAMIAMLIEDMLTDLQCEVVGPALHLQEALHMAEEGGFDFAILDVNLGGLVSFPVADVLRERDIPFIFASGYGTNGLIDRYRDVRVLKKPFTVEQMRSALDATLFA